MLRCGHCDKICESYEGWLAHLVTDEHQARIGMSDSFTSLKDPDRCERTLILLQINPRARPYDVLACFAATEPLGFITDAFIHIFPNVMERFYLIVFDQGKFVDRICDMSDRCGGLKVVGSVVRCIRKASLSEKEWTSKMEASFFYRRHEQVKRALTDLHWDEQLTTILKLVSLDAEGYQKRESVIEQVEGLIHEEYPEATVNPFGSCLTWLADTNADIDLYVDALGTGGRNDMEKDKKLEILNKIAQLLRFKYDKQNVFALKHARIPLVKISHPSGLKVDLSFENCISVQNSKMIRIMTKLDYRVRPFLIFLRYWARFHDLIGPNSIKSYALILMAFVYLRKQKILPSVYELQNVKHEGIRNVTVCGWNATVCNSRDVIQHNLPWLKCCRECPTADGMSQAIMKLCHGFFTEYMNVDFGKMVVCPLVGDFITQKAFDSACGAELPVEMGLLKANMATGQCTRFDTQRYLCIQDPFTLNINVVSNCCSLDVVHTFKAACAMASEALKRFVSTYDLADKENIVELCCQLVTESKKREVNKSKEPEPEPEVMDLDSNIDYIMTEATTTTNDFTSDESDDTGKNVISGCSLKSIKDFYKEEYDCKILDKNESRKDRSNGRTSRRSEADSGRVERINLNELERHSGTSYTHYDRHRATSPRPSTSPKISKVSTSTSENAKNEKAVENPLKKFIHSLIVVPNKKEDSKKDNTKVGSSSSSSSSISSSQTLDSTERRTRRKEKENTTTTKKKKKKDKSREKTKAKDKATKGEDKQAKKTSGETVQPSSILVQVKNDVEMTEVKTESLTAASVADTKTDPRVKMVPVVRFLSASTVPSMSLPHSNHDQVKVKVEPSSNHNFNDSKTSVEIKTESKEVEIQPDVDEDIDAEVRQFLETLEVVQQIQPPDVCPIFDNNYGYSITPKTPFGTGSPKQVQARPGARPYVVPNARMDDNGFNYNSPSKVVEETPPPSGLRSPTKTPRKTSEPVKKLEFPAYSCCLSDEFYQSVAVIFWHLPNVKTALSLKSKVFWINAAYDLLGDQQVWAKLSPIIEDLRIARLDNEDVGALFELVELFRVTQSQLAANTTSIPNRKRTYCKNGCDEASDENESEVTSPMMKLRKTSPPSSIVPNQADLQAPPTLNYDQRVTLQSQLAKIPSNVRRNFVQTIIFRCHPQAMVMLRSQWQNTIDLVRARVRVTSPLETLGKICGLIKSNFLKKADREYIKVKMVIAFDTASDPPAIYFGNEYEFRPDDPDYKKQEEIQATLENVLTDIVDTNLKYRLAKYFK